MSAKEVSEMSFREFVNEQRGLGNVLVEEMEREIIGRMLVEGFSEEDIYNMPMPRLYGLYLQVLGEVIENEFSRLSADVNPELASHKKLEDLTKRLKESLEGLEKLGEKPES